MHLTCCVGISPCEDLVDFFFFTNSWFELIIIVYAVFHIIIFNRENHELYVLTECRHLGVTSLLL